MGTIISLTGGATDTRRWEGIENMTVYRQ